MSFESDIARFIADLQKEMHKFEIKYNDLIDDDGTVPPEKQRRLENLQLAIDERNMMIKRLRAHRKLHRKSRRKGK